MKCGGLLALPPPGAGEGARERRPGELGMWIFIASEVLFFGGLLLAYAWGRAGHPEGFAAASRQTHVLLGTLNTAILLSSSLLVALAAAAMEAAPGPQQRRRAGRLLLAAAVAGGLFLVLKGFEYRAEWQEHLFPGPAFALPEGRDVPGAQLFFVFYFLATGLHGLHVAAGAAWLGLLGVGLLRGRAWADAGRTHVAGLYWHFVDVVWVLLYPLIYLVERHA